MSNLVFVHCRFLKIFLCGFVFLTPLGSDAQSTCSSKDLVDRSCAFYTKNSKDEFITTSDGRKFKNPLFAPTQKTINSLKNRAIASSQHGDTLTASYAGRNQEVVNEKMDSLLELSMNTENILSRTELKSFPLKSLRSVSTPKVMKIILQSAFPNEKFGEKLAEKDYLPKPLNDPNGKLAEITVADLEKLKKIMGPENLVKLKDLYREHAQKNSGSALAAEYVTPRSAPQPMSQKKYAEENRRMQRIFEYSQEKISLLIRNGRSDLQLSPEQKHLLKRIASAKYQDPRDLHAENVGHCAKYNSPYYYPSSHTVTICENFYDLADAQIAQIMAHELGHSIDPCISQKVLYEVDSEKLDDFMIDGKGREGDQTSLDAISFFDTAKGLSKWNVRFTHVYQSEFSDPGTEKELIKIGLLKDFAEPVSEKNYPFNTVRSCLINAEKIDDVSDADIDTEINNLKSYKKRAGVFMSIKEEKQLRDKANKVKTCEGTSIKRSEINEAMSDFFGAFVQAQYMNEFPPKTETDAFAAMSVFTGDACGRGSAIRKVESYDPDGLQKTHPLSFRRLESTFFKMPSISKHFGCELKPKSKCFTNQEHFFSSNKAESSKNNEVQK